MDRLIEGYRRFRETYWAEHRGVFEALAARGQNPRAMVIACCDSRVSPEVIFDTAPGEILVARNVANLVPPYAPDSEYHGTSAALEFAVRKIQVDHIIVMGHSNCGGVQALLSNGEGDATDFIGPWMSIAATARERARRRAAETGGPVARLCEHETVGVSLANLMSFPWVKERVEDGRLALHGWYFNVETGALERLDLAA